MSPKLENLIKKAKDIKLTDHEKSVLLHNISAFIKNNPVVPPVRNIDIPRLQKSKGLLWGTFHEGIFINQSKHSMILGLIIALFALGGTSVAAGASLPGELLYPIKIHVNEEVRGVFEVSPKAKADWESERALLRLSEAEELAAEGTINSDEEVRIVKRFEDHAKKSKERAEKAEEEGSLGVSAETSSNLESSLRVHEGLLKRIKEEQGNEDELDDILEKVQMEIGISAHVREREENKFIGTTTISADIEARAQGKLRAAENKLAEVKKFVESRRADYEAEVLAETQAHIAKAEIEISLGKTKMESKLFGDAFISFQKAMSEAQAAKLVLTARARLKLHEERSGQIEKRVFEDERRGGERVEKKDSDDSLRGSADMHSDTEIRSGGDSSDHEVKTKGSVNINLGL